jgi:hypothetical protein
MRDIIYMEMISAVLAIHIWGNKLRNKKVIMHIDNEALVRVFNCQGQKG